MAAKGAREPITLECTECKRRTYMTEKNKKNNTERLETTKIIETHMWPLTITKVPRSKEAFLVCFVDKIMALAETLKIIK